MTPSSSLRERGGRSGSVARSKAHQANDHFNVNRYCVVAYPSHRSNAILPVILDAFQALSTTTRALRSGRASFFSFVKDKLASTHSFDEFVFANIVLESARSGPLSPSLEKQNQSCGINSVGEDSRLLQPYRSHSYVVRIVCHYI